MIKILKRKYLNIFNQIMSLSLVQRHQSFVYALPKEISITYRRKKHILRWEDLRVYRDHNNLFKRKSV